MLLKSFLTGVSPIAGACRVATVFAVLFLGQISSSLASPGCNQWNGVGTFNRSTTNNPTGIIGFAAGDILSITVNTPGANISVGIGNISAVAGANLSASPTLATYTVTTATAGDRFYDFIFNTSGGSANFTFACTNAPVGGAAPTPSQKLAAVVTTTTKTVAYASGQVITNQVQAAIDDAFSPNGTPTNVGPNGGFINFAAEPEQSDVNKRADDAFAALGYATTADKSPRLLKAMPRPEREWSAWADIRGT